jgi:TonB family protein
MKRIAFALAFLLGTAGAARADLRYTSHTEARKTNPSSDPTSAIFAQVAEVMVSAMAPGGSIDVVTLVGSLGQRFEYSKAMPALAAGSVGIQLADGIFVLNPGDKTYWKIPATAAGGPALPAGMKTSSSYTRTGEYATIAGVRAERIAMKVIVATAPGASVQISVEMTGDLWVTDQFKNYQATIASHDQLTAMLGEQRPNGFVMRATIRGGPFGPYEIDRTVTSIAEEPSRPELFAVSSDYREVPMPSASSIAAALAPFPAPNQPARPLFNGATLTGMVIDHTSADVAPGGVLGVHGGPGWVRTNAIFADYTLSFDARLTALDAALDVFVRTWPTLDAGQPNNGYRVRISDQPQTDGTTGHMVGVGHRATELSFDIATLATTIGEPGRWHHYEITVAGHNARLVVDRKTVMTAGDVGNSQGVIALRPDAGVTEFRSIVVAPIAPRRLPLPPGVSGGGPTVHMPEVVHQEKPKYTAEAMRARIQGNVLVAAVVGIDGTVQDPKIVQSLDSELGLDNQALECAKAWQFQPGTKDDVPVPVMVTIDVRFAIN